ncbi:MAG: hypothetical protein H7240_02190 [Glaciimonas sp.]|nr:hypothetical protein [Glaciimonas sp.]
MHPPSLLAQSTNMTNHGIYFSFAFAENFNHWFGDFLTWDNINLELYPFEVVGSVANPAQQKVTGYRATPC